MTEKEIQKLIESYLRLTHEVWKRGEILIRRELDEQITNDQHYLMRYIHRRGKCTTTELAHAFAVQKSAITAIVNRLVEKNLLERIRGEKDRRVIYLTLTDEGKVLFNKAEANIYQLVESILTRFDRQEIEQFMNTFEKLAKILKEM